MKEQGLIHRLWLRNSIKPSNCEYGRTAKGLGMEKLTSLFILFIGGAVAAFSISLIENMIAKMQRNPTARNVSGHISRKTVINELSKLQLNILTNKSNNMNQVLSETIVTLKMLVEKNQVPLINDHI